MGKLPHTVSTGNQFTHTEWTNSNLDHLHNAESSRHVAERIRSEAELLIADRNNKTVSTQLDVSSKLADRARDIREWKEELVREVERIQEETDHLQEARRHLEYSLGQTKRPLKVCQENLSDRENRVGIDQVKDAVEKCIKREIENIKRYQQRFLVLLEVVDRQINENVDRKEQLDKDCNLKTEAYSIDQTCCVVHNDTGDISLHAGIERVEQAASVPLSWQENSQAHVRNSTSTRQKSEQVRIDVDALVSDAAKDLLHYWTNTNKEFQERISETQDIHGKLTSHLHLVDRDILQMDALIDQLRSTKLAKQTPLKVAQTRLKRRSQRPDIEACNDPPHNRLVDEVSILNDSILLLQHKITEAEAARLDLLSNKQRLENDIRVKANSLNIDQQKCMTNRLNFPYNLRCSVTSKRVERRKFRLDLSED